MRVPSRCIIVKYIYGLDFEMTEVLEPFWTCYRKRRKIKNWHQGCWNEIVVQHCENDKDKIFDTSWTSRRMSKGWYLN